MLMSDDNRNLMHNLETRIKSFESSVTINKKKVRWRFTVIPGKSLARLGFYYSPCKNKDTNKLDNSAITCVYCKKILFNIASCKSKKRNTLETIINILQAHLTTNEDTNCLSAHLRLLLMKRYQLSKNKLISNVDWKNDKFFNDPLSIETLEFRKFTYNNDWKYNDKDVQNLSITKLAEAGLMLYDRFLTNFEEDTTVEDIDDVNGDFCYCIYCNNIIGSWQEDDDPLEEHFKSSKGPSCYFFKCLESSNQHKSIVEELRKKHKVTNNDERYSDDEKLLESVAPAKKKIKLTKRTTKMLSNSSEEEEALAITKEPDTSLIINVKEHIKRGKIQQKELKNKILDDSVDDLSFSNVGNESFSLPAPISPSKILQNESSPSHPLKGKTSMTFNALLKSPLVSPSKSSSSFNESLHISKRIRKHASTVIQVPNLEDINLSYSLSSDEYTSSSDLSTVSTPINSPSKSKIKDNSLEGASDRFSIEPVDLKNDHNTNILTKEVEKVISVSSFQIKNSKNYHNNVKEYSSLSEDSDVNISLVDTGKLILETKVKSKESNSTSKEESSNAHGDKNNGQAQYSDRDRNTDQKLNVNNSLRLKEDTIENENRSNNSIDKDTGPDLNKVKDIILMDDDLHDISNIELDLNHSTPKVTKKDILISDIKQPRILEHDTKYSQSPSEKSNKPFNTQSQTKLPSPIKYIHEQSTPLLTKTSDKNMDKHHISSLSVSNSPDINFTKSLILEEGSRLDNISDNDHPATIKNITNEEDVQKSVEVPIISKNFSKGTIETYSKITNHDKDFEIVKEYFQSLLKYVNVNDAHLANDINGDLRFFYNQIPKEELELTFDSWIDLKLATIREDFNKRTEQKLTIMKDEFRHIKQKIDSCDDDATLLEISKQFGIL
ncbi:hypothetical protein TPHA_0B01390 [Tetrapisispora phaffii CBS 4417]|uniref:Uncharacterized protein n=1 Tax=Tetrapisispora phaffii (strain ATCC 24235 / CBS 4417 / NBRC 1672 / NRRL Y-8282 / UCD 70-5) TaxID=1071381 RepID=G8BP81_TETPH|nr:hypothetical protein TPHA_0B01390 [Tetrapisispora phaffii CBS 4417]CCE61812.1 hypothetical protein TPHA_0B01390 [Tetrapisispora phaffii CBS 4417]